MRAFDDFVKRKLIEQFTDVFSEDPDNPENNPQAKVGLPNNQALAIWLTEVATERLLCQDTLAPFFQSP